MELVKSTEGHTELLVPKMSLSPVPPSVPVFYNPAASINRSVSVAIVQATEGTTFCDALAGVGARGVRIATEVGRELEVMMIDLNPDSINLGRRNARLNGVSKRCASFHGEANSFLHSRYGRNEKMDYVDVDPFGTPVPFMQSALSATGDGGLVSFTATDTAVLCGVHQRVAERRYGGTPLNNHFHHETGIRLLANAIRREAGKLDLGIRPVAAHSTRHYIRVFVRVEVGPTKAEAARDYEGYVQWCRQCGSTTKVRSPSPSCGECGRRLKTAGPLWVGKLTEDDTVGRALAASRALLLPDAEKILSSQLGVDGFPPWSFSVEGICSAQRRATVPDAAVASALAGQGFKTLKQPFEKTGLKTDAEYREVARAVEAAASSARKA